MNEEIKLDNLNFESVSPKEEVLKEHKPDKKDSKNFITIFLFTFVILITSILVISYYLFLNKNNNSNQYLTTEVELISKSDKSLKLELSSLMKKTPFEVSIYQSEPRKDLKYLGEGILIDSGKVLTNSQVIKDLKLETLIIKQNSNTYEINLTENLDLDLVYLNLKEGKLEGAGSFINSEIRVGDRVFIKSITSEIKGVGYLPEEVHTLNILNIVGSFKDESKYLTDFSSDIKGNGVYNEKGELIGLIGGSDSRNKVTIVSGKFINQIINSSKDSKNESNKDKLGVVFEFSDLAKFRKEGRPVGLVVSSVKEGSISEISGIKKDDIVLTLNNQVIVSQEELDKFFNDLLANEEIKFEIIRADKKIGITLSLQ